jgi:DNA invertase Pin-like site-specific DNA recombinase
MARRTKRITTQPGYVKYLRTSDEDAQAPERSQNGQRRDIQRLLVAYPDLSDLGEYIDNYTGTSADRKHYQRMLSDARKGAFSHVFAAVPDRFGRDDVEALRAIDELTQLGICVRFAGHPDLDPADMDDRLYLNILFGMAKREAAVIAKRSMNGMLSKLLKGGWPWMAPDGYLNKEAKLSELEDISVDDRLGHGKYKRWVEIDPEQAKVWRYAWDLLLTDRYTLADICEKLYERGYRLKNGKPFVTVKANGERDPYVQQLSRVFHNWHYAGWVVSENDWANIPPKTVRAEWEPIVSTEEFEQGLAILAKRSHMPTPNKRYFYLLQGLVYLQQANGKLRKLTCGTPNANRARGGVSYYCIQSSNQNFLCWKVDEQIPAHLQAIQVDPELIPEIRRVYLADMGRYTSDRHRETQTLQKAIKKLEEKEINLWRAFTEHGMRPQIYEQLSREYEDERQRITAAIDLISKESGEVVDNLDAALTVISEIADRYAEHTPQRQRDILKQMVKRVVIDPEGRIIRMELKPPFNYLDTLAKGGQNGTRGKGPSAGTKRTSTQAGSLQIKRSDPGRIRTFNQLIKSQLRCQLRYRASEYLKIIPMLGKASRLYSILPHRKKSICAI